MVGKSVDNHVVVCYSVSVGNDGSHSRSENLERHTMARNDTATLSETETETNQPKATRKRIDVAELAAQNPHEKVVVAIPVPAEMRVLLRQQAEQQEVSEAQYIRDMLAGSLGYTVPASFNERKRRATAFESEEARKEHIKQQAAERRNNVNNILKAIAAGQFDAAKLAELGIDVSALPKPRD